MNEKNVRRCCACYEHAPKDELIRIVRTPEGVVKVDPTKRAGGRGVWVHAKSECIAKLKKKKLLGTVLKCDVPDEVYGALDEY